MPQRGKITCIQITICIVLELACYISIIRYLRDRLDALTTPWKRIFRIYEMLSGQFLTTVTKFAQKLSLKRIMKDQAKAYQRATQVAGYAVGNIRTVAAFSAEDRVQALFANELEGPQRRSMRKGHVTGFFDGLTQFFLYNAQGMSLWYAGKLVASGEATLANAMKVFFMFVVSSWAAADAFTLEPDLAKGGAAIASLFQIIDRVTKIEPDNADGEEVEKIEDNIELKQVTMVYPSRPDVIVWRGMNLEVKSGHSLALVGASGSGKSSMIALIERFHDRLSGEVLIDGMDITKYNLQSLRQHIALVQQEPHRLMHGRTTVIVAHRLSTIRGADSIAVVENGIEEGSHNSLLDKRCAYSHLIRLQQHAQKSESSNQAFIDLPLSIYFSFSFCAGPL